jgi:major inositol transporter-like SP family MFS transporter
MARDIGHGASAGHAPRQAEATGAHNRFLTKLTIISTLGGLLFGYDTGVISGALLYMRQDLGLSSVAEGAVVSSLLFGAVVGALVGGKMADALGRRGSILICAILFLVGALGSGFSPTVALMVASRIILGLGVGAASVTVPVYLAEMAPAHRRGRMVTINEFMIVTGQLLAFVVNTIIDQLVHGAHVWRVMLSVAAIPAVFLFIGMLALPDSPRWYAVRGRLDDTRRVLDLSRDREAANEEYSIVAEHAARDVAEDKGTALRDLREFAWMRRILWIGIGLAVAQQFTGVNTIVYYGTTILQSTGLGASASIVATVSLGVISVIGVITGIILLGRFNRRPLLIFGFSAVAAAHVVLALSFLLPQSTFRSYLILVAMLAFMFCMQTFAGPLVWLILSEIFPMTIRGFAVGLSVAMLWAANTFISFTFPIVAKGLGSTPVFLMFTVINVISLLFTIKFVPETRGRTLEELEDDFRTHDAAHFTHQAPVGVYGS